MTALKDSSVRADVAACGFGRDGHEVADAVTRRGHVPQDKPRSSIERIFNLALGRFADAEVPFAVQQKKHLGFVFEAGDVVTSFRVWSVHFFSPMRRGAQLRFYYKTFVYLFAQFVQHSGSSEPYSKVLRVSSEIPTNSRLGTLRAYNANLPIGCIYCAHNGFFGTAVAA